MYFVILLYNNKSGEAPRSLSAVDRIFLRAICVNGSCKCSNELILPIVLLSVALFYYLCNPISGDCRLSRQFRSFSFAFGHSINHAPSFNDRPSIWNHYWLPIGLESPQLARAFYIYLYPCNSIFLERLIVRPLVTGILKRCKSI